MTWTRTLGLMLASLLISCALISGSDDRAPQERYAQAKLLATEPLRVMTYNIRHAEESSLSAIAEIINAQAPDLVGLQEVDENTARSGGVDQANELARLTGLHASFQPALMSFDGGRFGVALLSRYPILASERFALTAYTPGDRYILARMQVDHSAFGEIPVAVTHLSYRSDIERDAQAREIAALLAHSPKVILLGDLNATPGSPPYFTLARVLHDGVVRDERSTSFTFPARSPRVEIDHIFLGADWAAGSASTLDARWQSDHRPLMAGLRPKARRGVAAHLRPPR